MRNDNDTRLLNSADTNTPTITMGRRALECHMGEFATGLNGTRGGAMLNAWRLYRIRFCGSKQQQAHVKAPGEDWQTRFGGDNFKNKRPPSAIMIASLCLAANIILASRKCQKYYSYADKHGYTLFKALEKELGGNVWIGTLHLLGMKIKPYTAIAHMIKAACAGIGTNPNLLCKEGYLQGSFSKPSIILIPNMTTTASQNDNNHNERDSNTTTTLALSTC